jgi:V/A-type H+/Na+-transporting ATPase subunit E
MGFEELKKKVLKEAEKEEEKLLNEAEKEKKRIEKEAQEEIDLFKRKIEDETEKEINLLKRRELASANLEVKKRSLKAKEDIIDLVFLNLRKDLSKKLSQSERKKLLNNLLKLAENQIEVGIIYCNKEDVKLIGKDCKTQDILGGIIAETKDGSVRLDYSFETLIEGIREKYIAEITEVLNR